MYNTGDIGRLRLDGELDHLGREDDQVKIKVRFSPSRLLRLSSRKGRILIYFYFYSYFLFSLRRDSASS